MINLENYDSLRHIIEEERPLESVRVSICYESESEATCGNSVDAEEGKNRIGIRLSIPDIIQ
jgi:hypothetical protein